MKNNIINFYFFRTEAEAICCSLIANKKKDEINCLISYKLNAFNTAKYFTDSEVYLFELKAKNYISRTFEIKRQINFIKSKIADHENIVLHLSNYATNTGYIVNALVREHKKVSVQVYPHGLSKVVTKFYSFKKMIRMKIKKYGRIIFGISYYDNVKDIRGLTSPLTEKVYVYPGLQDKTLKYHHNVELIPIGNTRSHTVKTKNSMLIIGQRAVDNDLSHNDINKVIDKFKEIAKNEHVEKIDYLPHPRAKRELFFYDETFNKVSTKHSAEILAMSEGYRIVASFSSTSLIFARLLNPDSSFKVYSVGLNKARVLDKFSLIRNTMSLAGVQQVDID